MLRRWSKALGWLLLGIFAAAVIDVCRSTNGGWEILRNHLIAGLPPVVRGTPQPSDTETSKQTRWRIEEAQRVAADPHASAGDCLGATLVLASNFTRPMPDPWAVGRTMWKCLPLPEVDEPPENWAQIRSLMRQLMARAIEMEPENVQWRRLRTFVLGVYGMRTDDVASIEDDAQHDPDNALYDYVLALNSYGEANFEDLFIEGQRIVRIEHPEFLDKCQQHLEAAMHKPQLAVGRAGLLTVGEFFEKSPAPIQVKAASDLAFELEFLREHLFDNLDWLGSELADNSTSPPTLLQIDHLGNHADAAAWLIKHRLGKQWAIQWEAGGDLPFAYEQVIATPGAGVGSRQWEFIQAYYQWRDGHWDANRKQDATHTWSAAAVAFSSIAWLLAAIGAVAVLGVLRWRRLTGNETPRFFLAKASLVWLVLFAATYSYFGLLPTFKPRLADYHWSATAAFCSICLAIYFGLLWYGFRVVRQQGKLPSDQRLPSFQIARWLLVVAIGAVFVVAMQCAVDGKFRYWVGDLARRFPSDELVDEIRLDPKAYYSPRVQSLVGLWHSKIASAFVQWGIHGGLFWTTGLWLFTLLGWLTIRAKRQRSNHTEDVQHWSWRITLIGCIGQIGKAALAMSLVLFLLSVAAVTLWLDGMQFRYQQELARLKNPQWLVEKLQAEAAAIEESSKAGSATGPAFSVPVDSPTK